jgi:hypothetical protein
LAAKTPGYDGCKFGFSWILSSESGLFNGLRGIFAERNFSRPFVRETGIAGERGAPP